MATIVTLPDDASLAIPPEVRETIVTVGTFDGVHLGHQDVLTRLSACARESGRASVLVTFEPHPLDVVNPSAAPPLLTAGREKLDVLAQSGVDYVAVLPFTRRVAALDAAQFVDQVLRARFNMVELLMGYDHGFGRGRSGDVATLQALGAARGIAVDVVPAVLMADGHAISSTFIRRAVAGGDLARAAAALGRRYSIGGTVQSGAGRGRDLGFRTLNLALEAPRKLLPPEGVYAVQVHTPHGAYGGMMNLGGRPTFGESATVLEAHCFDMTADLYGAWVRVDVVGWLRGVQRFDGPEALVAQLQADEAAARRLLASLSR
jgi:riboflavin kinase / FMN adenylyltransferase